MYGSIILAFVSLLGVKGKVLDKETKKPVEYAVVILHDAHGKQVTGTYTDSTGSFFIKKLKPGKYYVVADFIGYRKYRSDTFTLKKGVKDVGKIFLSPAYIKAEPVISKAKSPHIRHEVDRTIVTPSEDIISSGGNASDVLRNVPGVSVSPTGEVLIKNSSNYTVLINNKPTMLPPDQALKEIPASQIEKIEIITNPSAEYDPESNAIINIALKKARFKFGKSFTLRLGTFKNYGASSAWGAERGNFNFYAIGSYFVYTQPLTYSVEILNGDDTLKLDKTNFSTSDMPASARLGVNYSPDENTSLGFEGELGKYRLKYSGDFHYTGNQIDYFNPIQGDWKSSFYSSSLDFLKKMGSGELNISAYYGYLNSEKLNKSPRIEAGDTVSGTQMIGQGTRKRTRMDIRFNGKIGLLSLESGFRYSLKRFKSQTTTLFYSDTSFSNPLSSKREIYAGYGKLKGSRGRWNFGVGLRAEYMKRAVDTVEIVKTDLFPSLYIATEPARFSKLNLSYSRRIRRPAPYSINPVSVWETANELHTGNPHLKPQYNDSYEITFESPIGEKGYLSATGYYTYSKNYINKFESVDTSGVIVKREINFPYRKDAGFNFTFEWKPSRFVKFNITPDFYWYAFKETDTVIRRFSYKVDAGFSGLVIPVGFIQLYLRYIGPYSEPFGDFEPAFLSQLGYMMKIRSVTVMASFLDVFHTMKMTTKNRERGSFIRKEMTSRYPVISIMLKIEQRRVKQGREVEKELMDVKGM